MSVINAGSYIFLANITRIELANQQTQQQISSGFKISQPQDAPDQISQLLFLQANLSRATQVQTNLTSVQNSAVASDQAITSALQLADQAVGLGTEGTGLSDTPQSRQQLAQQVQAILSQVVSLSQTSFGGRYIFGGDSDQTPSYQLDPASATGVDRLSTSLNTTKVEDTSGGMISTGLTAGQIFDARNPDDTVASGNLFASLNSLYQALNTNNTAGITTAISSIQQASTYVNTQQEFYGALENRLSQSLSTATNVSTSLTSQISDIRDTNISQAAVQLTQGTLQFQAALEAQAKVPQTSLFNYLS